SVLALALGIGLTTTMFSIVYGALHRGLPFEEAHRVMHLERNNLAEDIQSMEVTLHDYLDWREQQTSFEDIAAFYTGTVNMSGVEGRPERFDGGFMTANAFDVLGVRPVVGRTFR
ncbi:MAG: permease, partial [Gemmatimonadetes bacterium]|nr:permease [Gemmatimonadota bacterium]NIT65475.1 permease [Gemmatimonadota bacterium]NIV22197.1 permease [Gemmatimonadota bacterium]NIW73934.1 permease [Gemmatimonadota bacterium]NIY34053.1 permease [Gemmatimonadota bacterium]